MSQAEQASFAEFATRLVGDVSDSYISKINNIDTWLREHGIPMEDVLSNKWHVRIAVVAVIADECQKRESTVWTKAATSRDYISCLSRVYERARDTGQIKTNPVKEYRELLGRSAGSFQDGELPDEIDLDQVVEGIQSPTDQALVEAIIQAGVSPKTLSSDLAVETLNHCSERNPSLVEDGRSDQYPSERFIFGTVEELPSHLQKAPKDDEREVVFVDDEGDPATYDKIRRRGIRRILARAYGDRNELPELREFWYQSRRYHAAAAFNFVTILKEEYQRDRASYVTFEGERELWRSTVRAYARQLVAEKTASDLFDVSTDTDPVVHPFLKPRMPDRLAARLNTLDQVSNLDEEPFLRSGDPLAAVVQQMSRINRRIERGARNWARILADLRRHDTLRVNVQNIGSMLLVALSLEVLGMALLGVNGLDDPRLLVPIGYIVLLYAAWRMNVGFPWSDLTYRLYNPDSSRDVVALIGRYIDRKMAGTSSFSTHE